MGRNLFDGAPWYIKIWLIPIVFIGQRLHDSGEKRNRGRIPMEPVNSNIQKLQQETLDKCQEYYDEVAKWLPMKGFIWLKNEETGQLMVYTRGEYTEQIMAFLKTLNQG